MTDDPFANPSEVKPAKRGLAEVPWGSVPEGVGRYKLPPNVPEAWEPGYDGKWVSRGWMRTTNLVGAYVDTRALHQWEVEMGLKGLADRHDLYEELCTRFGPTSTREDYGKLFERAKDAAKAGAARDRGTLRHEMVEQWITTGQAQGSPLMLLQLAAFREALRRHCLMPVPEYTECLIINDEVGCAGRFDTANRCLLSGDLHIGDLKSKRRHFFTLLEARAQLAVYAHATAVWDTGRLCYVEPPPFNREVGHIFHMPVDGDPDTGEPVVFVLELDLVKGWETARFARKIVDDRSEAKSKLSLAGARRPLPIPTVELYARWLSEVEVLEEGSRLVQEAQDIGVWCAELEAVAAAAARRLLALTG